MPNLLTLLTILSLIIIPIIIPKSHQSILPNNHNNNTTPNSITKQSSPTTTNNNNSTKPPTITIQQPPIILPLLLLPPVAQAATAGTDNGDEDMCKDFVESTGSNEFSSPGYPNEYFDNINCVKVISAGEGEVIRLRFLDHFHLEPDEKCQYDYLEIRDGHYGYSSHIATLCGTNPPTFLMSSGRHLWLRFTSDKDIHYVGFRASYEFIPSPNPRPDLDDCSFHLTAIDKEIINENITDEILTVRRDYAIQHIDCTWRIEAPANQRIMMQFLDFKMENANDCAYNVVEVYGSRTEYFGEDGILKQFCSSATEAVTSKTNVLHLRFYTVLKEDKKSEVGIKYDTKLQVYYNFFRDTTDKGPDNKLLDSDTCKPTEFDCTDNTCIDDSLRCNDKANCKQRNDEDKDMCNSGKAAFHMTMDLIVIAFIGCFLAIGMCSGLFLNICRKLRQDKMDLDEIRKIMLQASIHKSRESELTGGGGGGSNKRSDLKLTEVLSETKQNNNRTTDDNNDNDDSNNDLKKSEQQQQQHRGPPPSRNINLTSRSSLSEHHNNSSDDSKETVVYKPISNNEMLIGSSSSNNNNNKTCKPYGFVFDKDNKLEDSTKIRYQPPPPYNPLLLGLIGAPSAAAATTLNNTSKSTNTTLPQEDDDTNNEPEVMNVIEVRDCGCQTKESFTEGYLKGIKEQQQQQQQRNKRAPLARTEAFEYNNDHQYPSSSSPLGSNNKRILKRVPKSGNPDVLVYYPPPSSSRGGPGSVCSSSVDASTGSLEILCEVLSGGNGEEEEEEEKKGG